MKLKIGKAQSFAPGEQVCGDALAVACNGSTSIAVVDGLGHGPQAAEAAEAFVEFFSQNVSLPVDEILRRSTEVMSRTRGAAVGILRIAEDMSSMHWCGVGNIEVKAKANVNIAPISMPGIVGRRLRKLVVFEYPLSNGDIIIAHTDGISSRFDIDEFIFDEPQRVADSLLDQHRKRHDDASCVVLRVEE